MNNAEKVDNDIPSSVQVGPYGNAQLSKFMAELHENRIENDAVLNELQKVFYQYFPAINKQWFGHSIENKKAIQILNLLQDRFKLN